MDRLILLYELFEGHTIVEEREFQSSFLTGLVGATRG